MEELKVRVFLLQRSALLGGMERAERARGGGGMALRVLLMPCWRGGADGDRRRWGGSGAHARYLSGEALGGLGERDAATPVAA